MSERLFHFTVTTDIHASLASREAFREVCDGINDNVGGPGAFHITTGDTTSYDGRGSTREIREIIDEKFGSEAKWLVGMGNHDVMQGDKQGTDNVVSWLFQEYHNVMTDTLIESGGENPSASDWQYLDSGADLNTDYNNGYSNNWTTLSYDDSSWKTGTTRLGFADNPIKGHTTIISDNTHITYYFRKKFNISDVDDVTSLFMSLQADDGAVVYINGVEVARLRMDDGEVNYDTSPTDYARLGESIFYPFRLDDFRYLLVNGENIIAAEVHNMPGSADCYFDLKLEYSSNYSQPRYPISSFAQSGIENGEETIYYWDHAGVRFIQLNTYFNQSGTAYDSQIGGDRHLYINSYDISFVGDRSYEWLQEVISSTEKPVILFSHEPAFPQDLSHIYDSLNQFPSNRNKFWKLLEDNNNVVAHFAGHVHKYGRYRVDNSWDNSSKVSGDVWENGQGRVWEITSGLAGAEYRASGDSYNTFMDVEVYDNYITFNAWQNPGGIWSKTDTWTVYTVQEPGGVWYYTHNKPGTDWFNEVDNDRGWTVDFNLKVIASDNSDPTNLTDNKANGAGIYVNDGVKQETITFFEQQINFSNANKNITYDTTEENTYRLLGKGEDLTLYAKSTSDTKYSKIAEIDFLQDATNNGNALSPSVFEDSSGDLHATWWDDGNGNGRIYYSKYANAQWSTPVSIVEGDMGYQFPDIIVDSEGTIYVCYEAKEDDGSVVGMIYKNSIGWSAPFYTGIGVGSCKSPKIILDSSSKVCITWEDWRFVHPSIYLNVFLPDTQQWKGEVKLTNESLGAYRPSIASYLDEMFISWTKICSDNSKEIWVTKYNHMSEQYSSVKVSDQGKRADFSDVLANIRGQVFIVWEDNSEGKYQIFSRIISPMLTNISDVTQIVEGYGGARYPSLSEHTTTGDIYIVWQDYRDTSYEEFTAFADPYEHLDPYLSAVGGVRPLESSIYVAVYKDGTFLSSAQSSFDIEMVFSDNRNAYFPSVPVVFTQEMPIVYQSNIVDEYTFIDNGKLLSQVKSTFYDLSRDMSEFLVNYGIVDSDPYGLDRDMTINKDFSTKEIRFGDFSDLLNNHFIFKHFKYYVKDAVEPFSILEVTPSNFTIDRISASDAVINNYGDAWIVGLCGVSFYVDRQNRVVTVGDGNELPGIVDVSGNQISGDSSDLKKIKCIAFDKYNNMFIGGDDRIYYSIEHIKGFKELADSPYGVTAMVVDNDNRLFVGTSSSGLKVYNLSEESGIITISDAIENISSQQNYPSGRISSLKVDNNNCVWIGTWSGLYRFYKGNFLSFTTSNGMASDRVNDIAIRNTAIRYIATSNGIDKMVGLGFETNLSADDGTIWNNNVKSVMWREPNVLFAGTLSRLSQIIVNDDERTYNTVFYEPEYTSGATRNDLQTFYIITDSDRSVSKDDIIEVYINGNKVPYGYNFKKDNNTSNGIIRFETPLRNSDVVEVVVRKDLTQISTFNRTERQRIDLGESIIRIKDFAIKEGASNTFYVVTNGDENEIKVNDATTQLPFDKVHLDTTAPTFEDEDGNGLSITQIDKSTVRVNIEGAMDGVDGSGIESMVISNYENFTIDGTSSKDPVPFVTSTTHNLGISLEDIETDYTFSSGQGNVISYFSDTNELYAGSSVPASVYKYSWTEEEWEEIYSFDDDEFVDFITRYNDKLFISIGHPTRAAKVYVYNYTYSTGTVVSSLSLSGILTASESRIFCTHEMDGKIYMGSGVGPGNEYSNGSGEGGAVYVYDDGSAQNVDGRLDQIVKGLDNNVYDLTHEEGSANLLAVTGSSGYVYEIDVFNESAFIVYSDTEPLISIDFISYNNNGTVFTGGSTNGIIRRSLTNSSSYDVSFRTISSSINVIRTFSISVTSGGSTTIRNVVYAGVGNTLYYLSDYGSWVWKYTHDEQIEDITYNSNLDVIYVISDSYITKINPLSQTKSVYLKLIDRAGNESVLYDVQADGTATVKEKFTDSIDISSLVDFVNENQIMELDDAGNSTVFLNSTNRFYSADKIEEERGEYVSEVFDGSNDLVKWDNISWEATILHNTSLEIYVRTSTSQNDILTTDWIGPYYNIQSAGVDLSNMVGQFIQFKVVLTSEEKGITPVFTRASIRSVSSESIHFFTTNFVMPSRVEKGILTSQKIVPVSADVVFGINTTNSIDWTEYQEVDENRLFNINQSGENLRVGIKLISPSRSTISPTAFDEYGPYSSELYVNTIDFDFTNETSTTGSYHFRITLYEDVNQNLPIFTAYSANSSDGFSVDGESIPSDGALINAGETVQVLFSVPGSADITCNNYYYVKTEYIKGGSSYVLDRTHSFVASCTASFVDNVDFNFTNEDTSTNDYHFRVKFYSDSERTNLYTTQFSGNNRSGWFVDDIVIPEDGANVVPGQTVNVVYRPDADDFDSNVIYYLTIEAHDGSDYVFETNAYTFQLRDVSSTEYCGGYSDVPIVKNFGIMVELNDNEFVTLNI